jgi:glutathione S-transferase
MTPMSPVVRLVFLPVSPWSERARWVLDHHRIAYQTVEHVPILGERRLRRLLGDPPRRVTVPVLQVGEELLSDSWDIARYADRVGSAEPLIPPAHEATVRRWHDLAERAMSAARPLTLQRLLQSHDALREALPPPVPRWARSLLWPVAAWVTRRFAHKYGADLTETAAPRATVQAALAELRTALGAGDHLLSAFSYADIAMATLLQGVVPVADRFIPLGPATRAAWTQAELAQPNEDLVAWRDRLYARYRRDRISMFSGA